MQSRKKRLPPGKEEPTLSQKPGRDPADTSSSPENLEWFFQSIDIALFTCLSTSKQGLIPPVLGSRRGKGLHSSVTAIIDFWGTQYTSGMGLSIDVH